MNYQGCFVFLGRLYHRYNKVSRKTICGGTVSKSSLIFFSIKSPSDDSLCGSCFCAGKSNASGKVGGRKVKRLVAV